MKEQSSTSNQNLPKNKLALEEKYKRQDEDLPKPTGWRLLVLPFKMKDKTKGGLVLAESTLRTTTSSFAMRSSFGNGSTMLPGQGTLSYRSMVQEGRLGNVCPICGIQN